MSAMADTAAAAIQLFILLVTAVLVTFSTALEPHEVKYSPSLFADVLSSLGFRDMSITAANANLSLYFPATVFVPTDAAVMTCPACSLPLLLQEHSIPGLYTLNFLRNLAFGTKIGTLAPNRCLTVTASPWKANEPTSSRKVFVNGVEITKPDFFNNGLVVIHGVHGFMSHLSPDSCAVERMNTLSFSDPPPHAAEFFIMRFVLKEATMRLRVNGFSLLSLAIRVKYPELSKLKSMTVFALDDASIFAGGAGHSYFTDLMLHIVPDKLLRRSDLQKLPLETVLPTMEPGQKLAVTTAGGGGGVLHPLRVNFVKIRDYDVVSSNRIVVHGLSTPFPRLRYLNAKNEMCSAGAGARAGGACDNSSGDTQLTKYEGDY